jgi:hypothetical protein
VGSRTKKTKLGARRSRSSKCAVCRVGKSSRRGQHIAVRVMASPDICTIQGSHIDVMHKPNEPRLPSLAFLNIPSSSDYLPTFYVSPLPNLRLPLNFKPNRAVLMYQFDVCPSNSREKAFVVFCHSKLYLVIRRQCWALRRTGIIVLGPRIDTMTAR